MVNKCQKKLSLCYNEKEKSDKMPNIKIMSALLANKIAAGEVVEKCVSVVKELVENSVDAGSSEIKVELLESGLREIKVTDNGKGMDREDAILCFERHATSKLLREDDLFYIQSLGFRGEALASIASVSDVLLKTSNQENGTLVHIKGGEVLEVSSSDLSQGTSITVSSLFYNTPARLKHLSSVYSELASISEYMNKMALTYPERKFQLYNDGKELLNTDGSGNLLKVIHKIYGLDITKKMVEVQGDNHDYEVKGYISMPDLTRSNRNHMITFVNGRVIRNNELNRVINDSYHTFKENSRYPIVVLDITCDPSLLDVNIHPSKADIKFSNFEDLKNLITKIIVDCLKTKLLIPKIEIKEKVELPKLENLSLDFLDPMIKEEEKEYTSSLEKAINQEFSEKEEDIEELLKEVTTQEEVPNQDKLPPLYPVGLLLGTYIACQNEKGIYLIDQHAAKERINYEIYSKRLSHPTHNKTSLLVPIVIELPKNEAIILKENIDLLENMDIEIEEFGSDSFRISSHPVWLQKGSEEEAIRKIIDLVIHKEKDFSIGKFNDRLAMTISCKMSIKANTNISLEEMEHLIQDLQKCENPFHCPHGRPTIVHFSIYELEKMFKRSI